MKNEIIARTVGIDNYPEYAKRTLPDLGSIANNLAHMGLGLATEYLEFTLAIMNNDAVNIGEELGDIMWYNTNVCNILDISWNDIIDRPLVMEDDGAKSFAEFQDYVDQTKRVFAYGKDVNREMFADFISKCIAFCIQQANLYELQFTKILQKNIGKLIIRFPDKFDGLAALNRDTDAEREYLEATDEVDENVSEFED